METKRHKPFMFRRKSLITATLLSAAFAVYLLINKNPEIILNNQNSPQLIDCEGCNLVVISIDTLRADHLPFYGYERNTAPFLTSLAEKSAVFQNAFSPSSWTAPATASYFTSVFPSEHGVITGFAATKKFQTKDSSIELNRIPENLKTLGEYAEDLGFTTIGVADNLNIGKEIGFDRGFDYFKKYRYKGAPKVNNQVEDFISEAPRNKPYFLYIHFMDPHEPFHEREPFYSKCKREHGGSTRDDMICAYDSEISYVDRKIEELFTKYDWLNNSIVVLLSDHGEEFWDHGKQGHGTSLYTELTRVPFVLYHPSWAARTIKRNISTVDLVPTIAALTNGVKSNIWKGRNLISVIKQEAALDSRPILSERLRHTNSRKSWSKRSLIIDNWHLIHTTDPKNGNSTELFDLNTDFKEHFNIESQNSETRESMAALLEELSPIDGLKKGETIQIETDQNLLNELKTLGYIN